MQTIVSKDVFILSSDKQYQNSNSVHWKYKISMTIHCSNECIKLDINMKYQKLYEISKQFSYLHIDSFHKRYCMSFSICNRHCLRYIVKSCHIKKHFVSCSLCMHEFQLNLHVCLVFRCSFISIFCVSVYKI